jgi:hypothetical protein
MIVWPNDDPKGKNKYAYQFKELISTFQTIGLTIWYYLGFHKFTLYNQMKFCNPYFVSLHFCPIFILSLPIFLFYYNKREKTKACKTLKKSSWLKQFHIIILYTNFLLLFD